MDVAVWWWEGAVCEEEWWWPGREEEEAVGVVWDGWLPAAAAAAVEVVALGDVEEEADLERQRRERREA